MKADQIMSTQIAKPPNEKLLPIVKAVEAATGIRPRSATIIRWIINGVRGVKLQAQSVGHKWYCSAEDVRRFVDAQGVASGATASAMNSELAAINHELESQGF